MSEALRILLIEGSGRGFLSHYVHALALGLCEAGHTVRLVTGRRDELRGWRSFRAACRDPVRGVIDDRHLHPRSRARVSPRCLHTRHGPRERGG